jgi:hypothetical protein
VNSRHLFALVVVLMSGSYRPEAAIQQAQKTPHWAGLSDLSLITQFC